MQILQKANFFFYKVLYRVQGRLTFCYDFHRWNFVKSFITRLRIWTRVIITDLRSNNHGYGDSGFKTKLLHELFQTSKKKIYYINNNF